MKPDFSQLYAQLDLTPDCSLDQLKQAYRRRISESHPDRASTESVNGTFLPLSELNWIYNTALRFHRQHGRLPGARISLERLGATTPVTRDPSGALPEVDTPLLSSVAAEPVGKYRSLVFAGILILLLFGLGNLFEPALTDAGQLRRSPNTVTLDLGAELPLALEVGMAPDLVRAIQGAPIRVRGDHWDYGPSWLRFKRGRLSNWYSSPLRPLKTLTSEAPSAVGRPVE